jgi:hypothetical protein
MIVAERGGERKFGVVVMRGMLPMMREVLQRW